jgi:tellurite methyltransferase
MTTDDSIRYFDEQFQRQARSGELALNPFEQATLPYLRGRVLDFGCGMGNLAIAAARQGCSVVALDGSAAGIEHLQNRAKAESLPIEAQLADLREYQVQEEFDSVVCIGLLMFFDRETALRSLANLQNQVRPGGIAAVNVLIEGTTFMGMFAANSYCLFSRNELSHQFAAWEILEHSHHDFPAPEGTVKSFATLIARKPIAPSSASTQ